MTTSIATLRGTSNVTVGRIAHGLMSMTWVPSPIPDEQCFESIRAGVDALPPGVKMILNSAEFYSQDLGTANLELLSRFYARYPEYVDRTFLSVKGGFNLKKHRPDSSMENLRASIDNCQRALGPNKTIDLFEPARVDRTIPIEQQMENLVTLLKEGKFKHIGLSECNAKTLRRAHAVHPVTAAEIEISPWSYDDNQKEVIATAKELGIAVLAYSPLGRGFLTGQIKSLSDIPEGDLRTRFSRFKAENFDHNLAIVESLTAIANKRGYTPGQLSLAWVAHLGPHVIPLPGSSKATRTLENLQAGDIKLSDEDLAEVNNLINSQEVKGDRADGRSDEELNAWG